MCFKYIGQDDYGNRWWQDPTGQIMGACQLMRGSETPNNCPQDLTNDTVNYDVNYSQAYKPDIPYNNPPPPIDPGQYIPPPANSGYKFKNPVLDTNPVLRSKDEVLSSGRKPPKTDCGCGCSKANTNNYQPKKRPAGNPFYPTNTDRTPRNYTTGSTNDITITRQYVNTIFETQKQIGNSYTSNLLSATYSSNKLTEPQNHLAALTAEGGATGGSAGGSSGTGGTVGGGIGGGTDASSGTGTPPSQTQINIQAYNLPGVPEAINNGNRVVISGTVTNQDGTTSNVDTVLSEGEPGAETTTINETLHIFNGGWVLNLSVKGSGGDNEQGTGGESGGETKKLQNNTVKINLPPKQNTSNSVLEDSVTDKKSVINRIGITDKKGVIYTGDVTNGRKGLRYFVQPDDKNNDSYINDLSDPTDYDPKYDPNIYNRNQRVQHFIDKHFKEAGEIGDNYFSWDFFNNITTKSYRFSGFIVPSDKKDKNIIIKIGRHFDDNKYKPSDSDYISPDSLKNTLRHAIWQTTIALNYGNKIAKEIGDAHEDNPNADLNQSIFDYNDYTKNNNLSDEVTDLKNNIIDRNLGNELRENKNCLSMKQITSLVIEKFYTEGLWVQIAGEAITDPYNIKKHRISKELFIKMKMLLNELDENGQPKKEGILHIRKVY